MGITTQAETSSIGLGLLGGFRAVADGEEIAADAWPARRAAELVQLLALAEGRRLTRDEVIEALWPHLEAEAGARQPAQGRPPRAQGARRGGRRGAARRQRLAVPRQGREIDVERFEARARAGARRGRCPRRPPRRRSYTPATCCPRRSTRNWTQDHRARLRSLHAELLRASGQWERLVEVDPSDEPAYRELMRRELDAGSRPAAIRWYGRLRTALRDELGMVPSRETQAVYEECVAGLGADEHALVGREMEIARITALLGGETGASALVIRGPGGIGKSALCREVARIARAEGRLAVTVLAAEAAGPYAPLASVAEQLVSRDAALLEAVGERACSVLAELTPLVASERAARPPPHPPRGDRRGPPPAPRRRRGIRCRADPRRRPSRRRGDGRPARPPRGRGRGADPRRPRLPARARPRRPRPRRLPAGSRRRCGRDRPGAARPRRRGGARRRGDRRRRGRRRWSSGSSSWPAATRFWPSRPPAARSSACPRSSPPLATRSSRAWSTSARRTPRC